MRIHLPVAFTLLLAAIAVAQTPPCFATNDANTTVSGGTTAAGFSGQLYKAWQIMPTVAVPVQAAQIFTRNTALSGDRYFIVEIWSDNNNLPGTRLAGGTWKVVTSRVSFAWQGADLDNLVVLQPNVPAWVVWIEVGGSTVPTEPGGATMLAATSNNGTTWTAAAPAAAKIRLFCSQLDDVYTAPYGTGCPSSGGRRPSVFTNEQPMLGNAGFFFEMSGNPTGAPVFLLLGTNPGFTSVPVVGLPAGCFQNTDIVQSFIYFAGTGNTRGPTCDGYARHVVGIPSLPNLIGFVVAAQAVPFDAGATSPLQFVSSNAQRITLF